MSRDQSKVPALQNAIAGFTKNENRKYELLETQASSHILPPQINENSLDPTSLPDSEEFPQFDKSNERRNAYSSETDDFGRNMSPPPTGFEPPKLLPSYNQEFRKREEARLKQLGLPLTTPNKATQFSRQPARPATSAATFAQQPKGKPAVTQVARPAATNFQQSTKKPVVRTFDPDKNYKAFEHIFQPGKKATHKDYDFSRYFTKKQGAPTNPPAQRRQGSQNTPNRQQPAAKQPAKQPVNNAFNRQPVNAFKQQPAAATTARPFNQQTTTRRPAPATTKKPFVTKKPVQVVTTTRATTRATTTTRRPITTTKTTPRLQSFNQIQQNNQRPSVPAFNQASLTRDLLPPLDSQRKLDDETTKGSANYYPWKTPERGLLPPKLDSEADEVQSKRSIAEEGNFEGSNDFQSSESRRSSSKNRNSIKVEYKDLQKMFSIPQFEFPIESSGRDGYEKADAVNSFQVKIPYKNGKSERYYYLEHAHCNPECHPYFFKPGRCEPCIKL